jgi:hypothetical protein
LGWSNGIFELVREERMDAWVDSWVVLCGGGNILSVYLRADMGGSFKKS